MFHTAQERILYSQVVDYLEQGRAELVPYAAVEDYMRRGLLVRKDGRLEPTDAGRREYMAAKNERAADG